MALDAIELLTNQHREVERLWGEAQPVPAESQAQEIVALLSQHDALETTLLYPELRDTGEQGEQLSRHSLEEHQQVRELLKEVDGKDPSDPAVMATLEECVNAVQHHVQEEEDRIFPLLRQACDESRLREIGEKMETMMKTAPTHPHPSMPDNEVGAKVAGKVAGVVDRARDAMSGSDRPSS